MDEPPMDHYGMSYHPQSEDSLGHQPSTSIFPFMPSQKRVRTDSNTFESGEPQGLRASGVILMTSNGMHAMDLSTVVSQILARCEQLEKQNTDLKSDLDMTKITYDAQIHTLEESVDTLKDEMIASRSGTKTKTQPVRQDSAVTHAVQSQMLFLLDVTPVRGEGGKQVLTLPDPLTNGEPIRYRDADPNNPATTRTRLFNPNWDVALAKRDPINAQYLTTATEDVLNNAKANPNSRIKPADQTVEVIRKGVETFFDTLCLKYKVQTNKNGAAAKAQTKNNNSAHLQRKKAKLRRRVKALPAFETKHDVTGLQVLLRQEYMSSEESDCGEVEEDTWKAKAETFEERGVKALEVRRKNWRSKQVNRLYYALDKEAFKTTTALHARFHGFKENASDKVPKGDPPPKCMVDEDWIERTGHQTMLMNTDVQPFDLDELMILDNELGKDDVRALTEWDGWASNIE